MFYNSETEELESVIKNIKEENYHDVRKWMDTSKLPATVNEAMVRDIVFLLIKSLH